ncbi:hypothetical protein [Acidimangrovimonas pyrenivorans]|uniref:Secreted protein n=1 Tax=Acidimangrovimonas pyrenivorans TaxID=2030798 RepID=A0ABV7AF26_9RHOB
MALRMTWLRWLGPMLFGGLLLIALQATMSPAQAPSIPAMTCAPIFPRRRSQPLPKRSCRATAMALVPRLASAGGGGLRERMFRARTAGVVVPDGQSFGRSRMI